MTIHFDPPILTNEEWGAVICGLMLLAEDEDWPEPNIVRSAMAKLNTAAIQALTQSP